MKKWKFLFKKGFDSTFGFTHGYALVQKKGIYNFIDKKGKYLFKGGFDHYNYSSHGWNIIMKDGKWNCVNREGKFLSKVGLGYIEKIDDEYCMVQLDNGKWGYVDFSGNLLSTDGFDSIGKFQDGYAIVYNNNKSNVINFDGKLLLETWVDNIVDTYKGYFAIKDNGKCYLSNVELKGKNIFLGYFEDIRHFGEGYIPVYKNNEWNYIDLEGKYLLDSGIENIVFGSFNEGYSIILDKGGSFPYGSFLSGYKMNLLDRKGNILLNRWFDTIDSFENGEAVLFDRGIEGLWNIARKDGTLLLKEDLNFIGESVEGFRCVKKGNKRNYMNIKGEFLSIEWFDSNKNFYNGYGNIERNGRFNLIDSQGKLFLDTFCTSIGNFNDDYVSIKVDKKWNFIHKNGDILFQEWLSFDYVHSISENTLSVGKDGIWYILEIYE